MHKNIKNSSLISIEMNENHPFNGRISIIPLENDEGRKLLAASNFNHIVPYSMKQKNTKYCGLCSIAVCLNELLSSHKSDDTILHEKMREIGVEERDFKNFRRIDENHVLALGEVNKVLDKQMIDKQGMTLQEFADVVRSLNLKCVIGQAHEKQLITDATFRNVSLVPEALSWRAKKAPLERPGYRNVGSFEQFRDILMELLSTSYHVVINYDLSSLGYRKLLGHFSPLGGINLKEDRVLVLDTWPSVPMSWVKIKDLYNAMATVDSVSGKSRGFCAFKL